MVHVLGPRIPGAAQNMKVAEGVAAAFPPVARSGVLSPAWVLPDPVLEKTSEFVPGPYPVAPPRLLLRMRMAVPGFEHQQAQEVLQEEKEKETGK